MVAITLRRDVGGSELDYPFWRRLHHAERDGYHSKYIFTFPLENYCANLADERRRNLCPWACRAREGIGKTRESVRRGTGHRAKWCGAFDHVSHAPGLQRNFRRRTTP